MARVLVCCFNIIVILAVAHIAAPLIQNKTIHDLNNSLKGVETRRKSNKKHRSTSSDSQVARSDDDSAESLDLTISSDSSSDSDTSEFKKRYRPKSTEERKGWRKWHRKCPKCPEDMVKKWRDKSIHWICGGYQRARRSFKSECMMYYRNCQDGTMFVKIHDHRCQNDTGKDLPRGLHFFYDYGKDSDTSKTDSSESSSLDISSETY